MSDLHGFKRLLDLLRTLPVDDQSGTARLFVGLNGSRNRRVIGRQEGEQSDWKKENRDRDRPLRSIRAVVGDRDLALRGERVSMVRKLTGPKRDYFAGDFAGRLGRLEFEVKGAHLYDYPTAVTGLGSIAVVNACKMARPMRSAYLWQVVGEVAEGGT